MGAVSLQHSSESIGVSHTFRIYYPVRSHGFWPLCWELLSISCLVDFFRHLAPRAQETCVHESQGRENYQSSIIAIHEVYSFKLSV